jgi:hypothetical protein
VIGPESWILAFSAFHFNLAEATCHFGIPYGILDSMLRRDSGDQ